MNVWILVVVIFVCDFAASKPQNRSKRDSTADLFNAIRNGHEAEAIRLIENGANINAMDSEGWSFIHAASAAKDMEKLVEILAKKGADLNIREPKFLRAPIHEASYHGRDKAVEVLLKYGADVNIKKDDGFEALHIATYNGRSKVVEVLLKNGADVNSQVNDGRSPLHESAGHGQTYITELLLKHGANPHLKTNDGLTARDLAQLKGFSGIVELLDSKQTAETKLKEACAKYSVGEIMFNIHNGDPAKPTEFPWMAALGYLDSYSDAVKYRCAGTIISEMFILTAAHCVEESNEPVRVRIGSLNLFDSNGEYFQIQEIIRHANFSHNLAKNDIALIRLRRKIRFAPNKRPACLETDTNDLSAELRLSISGWGGSATENSSPDLLKAQLVTMPRSQCNELFLEYNKNVRSATLRDGIVASQYCAHDPINKSESCNGDSGGPLQIFRNARTAHVVAISSFGIPCGDGYPSIYTRVAYYSDWIANHVWP